MGHAYSFLGSVVSVAILRPERVTERRVAAGMSQSELARRVGIGQSSANRLEAGSTRNPRHIIQLAKVLGTTPEYLTGETDDPQPSGEIRFVPAVPDQSAEAATDADHVEIDMIDFAYGMGGTFTDTDHVDTEKVGFSRRWLRQFTHSAPNQLFTTKGIGDSMAPTISDHDIVVVDKSDRVPEFADKVWAIIYGGMAMIKRLRQLPDGSMLISSDNQLVRDARATDGELHVVGRVVAVVRKL